MIEGTIMTAAMDGTNETVVIGGLTRPGLFQHALHSKCSV